MADKVFSGTVILPDQVIERGWVLVSGGKIVQIGQGAPPQGEHYGGAGFLVLPGAIDAQVHSRSQKDHEDFIWSTRAAAAGGVSVIVDMPYDAGDLICQPQRFQRKVETAGSQARVDFALYATVHPEQASQHIDALAALGAAGFKFSTFGTDPDRFPRITPPVLFECFQVIARHGLIAGIHNENDGMVRHFTRKVQHGGERGYLAHGLSRPPVAETLAMAEVYELGAMSHCPVHVVHCSVSRGYHLAKAYREQGVAATVEACIHYLTLSEEDDVRRLVGKAKINPPVRGRGEREALWQHLAAGNVYVVSTDHVAWSEDKKSDPDMLNNASGVPGLEVLYPLLLKGLDERGLSLTWAARLLAHHPAALFRLGARKGALQVGCDGDIVLARRDPYIYDAAASGNTVVDWSPYDGMTLPFRIMQTFVRGHLVMSEGQMVGMVGLGEFVRPTPTSIGNA